jgi:hypothetical protein
MLSFAAIAEAPVSALYSPIPFGGISRIVLGAAGVPSLVRVSTGAALVSVDAFGTIKVIVVASGAALVEALAVGTPNFTLYAATREFISGASDQVPNQPFYGTLQQTIQFDQSIVNGDGFGQVTLSWGEITLINSDGGYDGIIDKYAADGRRLVLKVGDDRHIGETGYDGFFTVFDGIATGISVEEDVMRVFIRDGTYKLEVPAQPSIYGGTGGLDGTEDNKGKRRPKAWGYLSNITPVLVVPNMKLFQVNDGPVNDIPAVYNRAASVTYDRDYADYDALVAASVPPGKYATCLSCGLFRVNFVLEGEVTADVEGDATDGDFVFTSADIVKRVLSQVVSVPTGIENNGFDLVNALQPAPIGYYLDTSSSAMVADVISDIMGGIGGYGGFQRDGQKFDIGLFRAPSGVPSASYDETDIIDIKREQLPSGISPQPYRYRVAWGRNWTQQTDIAGSVAEERVSYLSEPYRLAEATDASIKVDHPLAQDPEVVESYFRDEADAAAEATRRLNLYGLASFSLYRFTLKSKPFVHRVGEVIRLTYPRWDLVNGRLLSIVSVSEKIESNEVEIRGFG